MAKRSKISGVSKAKSAFRQVQSGLTVPVNEASRKALAPTLKAAKTNLKTNGSVESGELLKLLTIKKDPTARKDRPVHVVGPSTKSPGYRAAQLVELGVAPHFQPELNRMHPGAAAKPFLRPAFEETKDAAVRIFGESIGPAIEKRAAKLAKKRSK
jgi:hypothetical protein